MKRVNGTSQIILGDRGNYYGWPSVACTPQGELIAVVSGNRVSHICPYGQTLLVRSSDGGQTWSGPELVNDTPLDDRDAGILAMRDGTLILTWFTSLRFESRNVRANYGPGFVEDWRKKMDSITQADRKRWLGNWSRRSTDGGRNWEEPLSTIVTAPHGCIELSDGRLLMVGNVVLDGNKEQHYAESREELSLQSQEVLAAAESADQGRSWRMISVLREPKYPQNAYLCEPHVVETLRGRMIAHFRYNPRTAFEDDIAWQSESDDGGHNWTEPHPTPIHGHPPHLLRLRNGWLLNTHGYRHPPFGQRACISRDGGETWDMENELIIRDDGPHADLGYPCTAQLPDDSLYTVYYQPPRASALCTLMGTHWRLEE